jgi:transposase
VSGIGQILALTMMLETGDIRRFPPVGHCASSCRCVGSQQRSHGKRKGTGNTKNGNQYLAWALVEAAHVAVRDNPWIKRFCQRQQAKTNTLVATKAGAHTWARACFSIRRDQGPFDVHTALQ